MAFIPTESKKGGGEDRFTDTSKNIREWLNKSDVSPLYLTPKKEIILAGWVETADEFYGRFTMSELEGEFYGDYSEEKRWIGKLIGAYFSIDNTTDEDLIKEYGLEYEMRNKTKILKYANDRIRLREKTRQTTLPYKLRPDGENKDKIALYLCSFLPFGLKGYDYKENTMGLDSVLGVDITGELYAKSIISGMWFPISFATDALDSIARFFDWNESSNIFYDAWNTKMMEINAGNKNRVANKSSSDFYRYSYKKGKMDGIADRSSQKKIKTLCVWRTDDEQAGLMGELLSKKGRVPDEYDSKDFDPSSQREYLVYECPKQYNIPERNTHSFFLEYPWLYNPDKFFSNEAELNSLPMCAALTPLGEVFVVYEEYLPQDGSIRIGRREKDRLGGKGDNTVGVPVDTKYIQEQKDRTRKNYFDDVKERTEERIAEEREDNERWSKVEAKIEEKMKEAETLKSKRPDLWKEWSDPKYYLFKERWWDKKDFTWEKFEELWNDRRKDGLTDWMRMNQPERRRMGTDILDTADIYAVIYYYGAEKAFAEWNAIYRKVGPYIPPANDEERMGWRGGNSTSVKKINEQRARANAMYSAYRAKDEARDDALKTALKPLIDAMIKPTKYYIDIQKIKDSESSERYKMEQEEKQTRKFIAEEKAKQERDRATKETESMGAEDVVIDKGGMKYEDFLTGFYDKRGRYRPQGLTKRGRPAKPPKEKENIKLTVKEIKPKAKATATAPKEKATATAKPPKSTKVQEKTDSAPTMADVKKVSDPDEVKRIANKLLGDKYTGDVPIEISTRKHQKYMLAIPGTRKKIHFGDIEREDFTKHKDEKRKDAFQKRNAKWKDAAWDTPAWLSYHLLW